MARVRLPLTLDCDNRCGFCAQRGLERTSPLGDPFEALSSLRASADEVTFTGGEPLLHPRIEALVARARALGFKRVGVQTNGRLLAAQGLAARLAAAGLTDVHLSIHGADPALHDYHAGVEGGLDKALLALGAARAQGLTTAVATVITRSNYRHLAPLARQLRSAGASAWGLVLPTSHGAAAEGFDRLMPRLGLAIPFVLHAVDGALKAGLPTFLIGAPACLLGPFASRLIPGDARAYGTPCAACPARAACPGLDAAYLKRFGGDELRPRAPFTAAPGQEALSNLFVGTGETTGGELPAHLSGVAAKVALTTITLPAK